ncbi:TonB-dependent receptor [Rufibacter roseus]|uniref:TonB-dependent receptor domain-containing protein n=1 Tax=Rufibacter roseus TaxID=1567108 RepID=A0ABW2DFD6_9BACT|nr:TonB-dependent receptor [Rufibacter roseus]
MALLLSFPAKAQQKITLSGYVKDKASGEGLIGATVSVRELSGTGAATNEYGFFSLTLAQGTYTVVVSYLGYATYSQTIQLTSAQKLNIELQEDHTKLQEVVITNTEKKDENVRSMAMSTMKMQVTELKKMPALMGEVDVIKAIQMTPGVQTAGEGTSGFYVRGGGVDQNLILLDEAPVYNASHLMGFFSVFNADAIKDVQLYKGGIPAEHGGRLSSLLDIRMKEGNSKRFAASGGIGTLSSRLTLEAPIVKDKGSFMVSGRRTYADIFFKLSSDEGIKNNRLYFYDLNLKANYTLGPKDRLFVSGYFGRDVAGNNSGAFNWGNATGTLRWNHLFNDKLFTNTTLIFSDFDYSLGSKEKSTEFTWTSHIIDYGLKNDYTFYLNPQHQLKFGVAGTFHKFQPGKVKPGPQSYFNEIKLDGTNAVEGAAYLSHEYQLSQQFTVEYGLRFSYFATVGKGTIYEYAEDGFTKTGSKEYGAMEVIQQYSGFEPRFSAKYELTESSALKASYNRMRQYLHLLSNSTASLPFDVWVPSIHYIKPQIADQVAAGYFRNFQDNTYEASAEVYYKHMDNQIDYKDNSEVFLNSRIDTVLLRGKGTSYGAEFMFRKQKGVFTGWVSYTWSKTDRTVPELNGGKAFPTRYDRRHSVNLVSTYQLNEKWSIGANWVYATGGAITMPVGRFEYEGHTYPVYSSKNGFRLPAYHRLDLAVTYDRPRSLTGKKYDSSWSLSIYNAYSRKNAFSISFRENEDHPEKTEAVKTYLFGIIPALTYNFNF